MLTMKIMFAQKFIVGDLLTNCYVLSCRETGEVAIVDPGFGSRVEAEKIVTFIKENSLKPKIVINTHGHVDHTCGNGLIKDIFEVPISVHEADAYMLAGLRNKPDFFGLTRIPLPADVLLQDGMKVGFGQVTLRVMHVPGHTSGSILLLGEKEVFTGDTLFAGSIGRTDFPESSEIDMRTSLEKLKSLSDSLLVYPGHGPKSTMCEEKRCNPFL